MNMKLMQSYQEVTIAAQLSIMPTPVIRLFQDIEQCNFEGRLLTPQTCG